MGKYINEDTKLKIKEMIDQIESKSEAEVVVAVADSCDRYKYSIFLYALLSVLIVPFLIKLFGISLDQIQLFSLMIATFLFVTVSLEYSEFKYKIIPKKVKVDRCESVAFKQFEKLGINKTANHKALLIFVSIKERYIRIIADKNINDKASQDFWNEVVLDFSKLTREQDINSALLSTVKKCGDFLEKNFPRSSKIKDNELSNEVLEIKT